MDDLDHKLFAYLRFGHEQGDLEVPEKSEEKSNDTKATDIAWLVAFGVVTIIAASFAVYASATFNVISYATDNETVTINDVLVNNFIENFNGTLILGLTLIPIVLCIVTILLYRYATAIAVWGQLFLSLVALAALTIYVWVTEDVGCSHISVPMQMTILLAFYFIIVAVLLFKRIPLVITLFNEVARCIFDMPSLALIAIVCIIVQQLLLVIYMVLWIVKKEMTFLMIIPALIVLHWQAQVVLGILFMTVDGAVARWYFAKDRPNKVLRSLRRTFRFHLGTICLGALLIGIFSFLRMILRLLTLNRRFKTWINTNMRNFVLFVEGTSSNAFVETAIHGEPFFKSGRRAVILLLSNLGNALNINYVGNVVLSVTYTLMAGFTIGVSYAVFEDYKDIQYLLTIVMTGFTLIVIFSFFAIFAKTIDTMFICYCEANTLYGGEQPELVSQNFLNLVKDLKKIYNTPATTPTEVVTV